MKKLFTASILLAGLTVSANAAVLVRNNNGVLVPMSSMSAVLASTGTLGCDVIVVLPQSSAFSNISTPAGATWSGRKVLFVNTGSLNPSTTFRFAPGTVDSVSIDSFGAIGDYNATANTGTDNTAAINKAIKAANANVPVTIPPKPYKFTGTILPVQQSQIIGATSFPSDARGTPKGSALYYVAASSNTPAILTVPVGYGNYFWGLNISNLRLIGIGTNAALSTGLQLNGIASSTFNNLFITGFNRGIEIDYGQLNTFNSISIDNCANAALYIGSNGITTTQTFNNSYFRDSPWGIYIASSASGYSIQNVFNGGEVESNSLGGVNINRGSGAVFNDFYSEDNPSAAANNAGAVFRLFYDGSGAPDQESRVSIVNSSLRGKNGGTNNSTIVAIDKGYQVNMTGNHFVNALYGVTWTGNTGLNSVYAQGNTWQGIPTFMPTQPSNILIGSYPTQPFNNQGGQFEISNFGAVYAGSLTLKNLFVQQADYVQPTGTGKTITIPILSQGSMNVKNIIEITGMDGTLNTSFPLAFTAKFAVGSLTTLSNLTTLSSSGNYASVAISGMNLVITLTSNVTNPILNIKVTTQYANGSYLFNFANITIST